MRIVSRYLFRQIGTPAGLAAIVVTFLFTAMALQEEVQVLIEQVSFVQLGILDLLLIAFFSLPSSLSFIIPVTFMFGVMFALGRLSANSELIALRASGISLRQTVFAVLFLGLVLSGICFALQNIAQPWAIKRLSQLVTQDVPLRFTVDMLPTGVMHHYGDWHIYIGGRAPDGTLEDIMVLQPQDDGRATTFYADTATVATGEGGSRIVMRNGHFIPESESGEARHVTFDSLTKSIPRYNPRRPLAAPRGMTIGELLRTERALEAQFRDTNALPLLEELRKFRIEIGGRFGLPLMCFAAALLGTPLAARIPRAGRSYAFATGVGVITLYFVLYGASIPRFPPSLPLAILLAQVPNLVLVALGSVVLWRVDRV